MVLMRIKQLNHSYYFIILLFPITPAYGNGVYGYYFKNHVTGNCYITDHINDAELYMSRVDPKTICQFSGLNDRNSIQF